MEIVDFFLREYDTFRKNAPRHINKQDWEEALHDTYVRLLDVKESVSSKSAYINRAIRGNVSHIVSKRKTIGSRLDAIKIHIESSERVKTPEQLLIDFDSDTELTSLINELPLKQRTVVQDVMSGLKVQEAAIKRNLNLETTKVNYRQGLIKLKNNMRKLHT